MAEPQANDDVLSLCVQTNYSPQSYKRFHPNLPGQPKPDPMVEANVCAEEIVSYPLPQLSRNQPSSFSPPGVSICPAPNALTTGKALTSLHRAIGPARYPDPTVLPILSTAPGSGATTVLATLGRALSVLGEHVLIIGSDATPMLPFHFGGPSPRTSVSLRSPANPFEGTLHLLGGSNPPLTIQRAMANLAGKLDRVLIGAGNYPSALPIDIWPGGACLVVVTPEPSSLLALNTLNRKLADQEQRTGRKITPYYVLNRFDASVPLHLAGRDRLREQLGAQIPLFLLPQSQAISDALAESATVIDTAPSTASAGAFFMLAEWHRSAGRNISTPVLQARESHLVQSAHG